MTHTLKLTPADGDFQLQGENVSCLRYRMSNETGDNAQITGISDFRGKASQPCTIDKGERDEITSNTRDLFLTLKVNQGTMYITLFF